MPTAAESLEPRCLLAAGDFGFALGIGSTSPQQGMAIATDGANIYVTGTFVGTVDFDPGPGVTSLTSLGPNSYFDGFVAKYSSTGSLVWARQLGGTASEIGHGIAVDGSGNVYTTGLFQGTVDFDPGPGTSNLTSFGGQDIFVSKLDSAGNFVYARQFGGTRDEVGYGIAVDGSGNVYTTGFFQGTVDFDSGAGTSNLTSFGNRDFFVSKLDSAGNFVYARQFGGDGNQGNGIAVDVSGNVYTTGTFGGTVDFDPSAGTSNLTNFGGEDIFVSKLDSAGNFVYARQLSGTAGEVGYGIALDGSGNVYTTGFFQGTVDFDPGAGTTNLTPFGPTDVFVSKLDSAGNFVYARQFGGTAGEEGHGIAVDVSGNVYTTGVLQGTADFDPGAGTTNLTSFGEADIFVSKLTGDGTNVVSSVTLSVDGASIAEANGQATVTATLSAVSEHDVTVDLSFSGTAASVSDYTRSATQIVIPAGSMTGTITLTAVQDTLDESNETIIVDISGVTNGTESGTQQVTATITDDDAATLSITDTTVTEGETAKFAVTLSRPSTQTVTVNYATDADTATTPFDFVPNSKTLTFAPGVTSQTVSVKVHRDRLNELTETFFVNLSAPTGPATITDGQGVGTILDNNPGLPKVNILAKPPQINEGENATFDVRLSAPSGRTTTVTYATSNGTAIAGNDYVAPTTTTLTFLPGETVKTINISTIDDNVNEATESFRVTLISSVAAELGATVQAVVRIKDHDEVPKLSINDVMVTEGPENNALFTVTLSGDTEQTVNVNYATAKGTAREGRDFTATKGMLTFFPGVTTQTISVPLINDNLNEASKVFFVMLSAPKLAKILDGQGIGRITDDDPLPTLSINDVSVKVGLKGSFRAVFTVTLSASSDQTVAVTYSTADGTAKLAESDFTQTQGVLTFKPGETTKTKTISVPIKFNSKNEPDENFKVLLSDQSNAIFADSEGLGTILSN